MAKLFESNSSPIGTIMKGVYISNAVIKEVLVNNNLGQYQKDFNYIFKLEKKVNEDIYLVTLFVTGKLYKDTSIPFHFTCLLRACGIEEYPNKNELIDIFSKGEIHPKLIEFFTNKEIKITVFVNDYRKDNPSKLNYKVWDGRQDFSKEMVNIYDVNTPNEDIIKAFQKALKSEYPPLYTPDLLSDKIEENEKTKVDNIIDDEEDLPI